MKFSNGAGGGMVARYGNTTRGDAFLRLRLLGAMGHERRVMLHKFGAY